MSLNCMEKETKAKRHGESKERKKEGQTQSTTQMSVKFSVKYVLDSQLIISQSLRSLFCSIEFILFNTSVFKIRLQQP